MIERFSGRFGERNAGDDSLDRWMCRVCWAENAVDSSPHGCGVCKRERQPSWLRLEDTRTQVCALGPEPPAASDTRRRDEVTSVAVVLARIRQLELGTRVLYRTDTRTSPAVVVGIDRHRRSLTLVVMAIKHEVHHGLVSGSTTARHVFFREQVLAGTDIQSRLAPLLADESLAASTVALVGEFGICGECCGVFHTRSALPADSDREQLRSKIGCAEEELDQLKRHKCDLIRSKQFEQVLALTTQINDRRQQITIAKRGLERLQLLCCPFCGSAVAP